MRFWVILGVVFFTAQVVFGYEKPQEVPTEGKGTIGIVGTETGEATRSKIIANGDPYASLCEFGLYSDSFGRGIKSAVLGGNRRARISDERCYGLGAEFARSTLASWGACEMHDFKEGMTEGLKASGLSVGNACYGLGYRAGFADFEIAAREGNSALVGAACVQAYRLGVADFKAKPAAGSRVFDGNVAFCYSLGLFEGPLAR